MSRRCITREDQLALEVIDSAFCIHRAFGPGLLESVYEALLTREISGRGLSTRTQVPVPLCYKDQFIELGFRADLVVEQCLLVELKSVEQIAPVHHKQLLTYLRVSGMRLGLLLNFGAALMKEGIFRIVNGLPET